MFAPHDLPKPVLRTDDPHLIRDTILHTGAIATDVELSFRLSPQAADGKLACVPVQINGKYHELDFVCCTNAQHQLSPAEKRLIALLRTTFSKYV